MNYPQKVVSIASEIAKQIADPNEAITEAIKEVQKLPEYGDFVNCLIRDGVASLIYRSRTVINHEIRKANGSYHTKPRGSSVSATTVKNCEVMLFNYFIEGRQVGDMIGKEIPNIAATVRRKANGQMVNAAWLESLADIVPPEKTVRQSVSAKRLKALWSAAKGQFADEPVSVDS